MSRTRSIVTLAATGIALVLASAVSGQVSAQDAKKGAVPNPGGAGSWGANVAQGGSVTLDEKQMATVKKVTAYFNELADLKGTFVQTNADNKRMRGKFFVKKPGRFRFDYAAPSKQVILSDGNLLAIQDHDLGNEDVVELDNTPFRILLRKDVDLLRDARIGDVQEADDLIIVSLQDKNPDAPGKIKLIMVKKPALELKEWVTTDAQGVDTRIELGNLVKTEPIDADMFKRQMMKKPL